MNKERENKSGLKIKAAIHFSVPQLDLPSLSIDIAAELKSALNNVTTLDQLQSHHSSGSEVSFQTLQSHFVDEKPTILSRKRPFSRLPTNSPRFSSRLGIDPTLIEDSMASQTMFCQTYKFRTGLGPARSETMNDQLNISSPKCPSSASQLPPSPPFSRQSSDDDKQLLPSSWPPSEPPMSPHTDAGSSVPTTPSEGLPRRLIKAPRNVTSRKRASSHVGHQRPSMIPKYQLRRFNFTSPSSPRSDAAIPRRDWSREGSATPMASKYRRTISTRHGEPSRGDLLVPGSSDGKYRDSTGGEPR